MDPILRGLSLFVCAALLAAQAPAPPNSPQSSDGQAAQAPAGLEASWEIAAVLQEIGNHAARLLPELDKVNAQSWVEKGASETYAEQLKSSREQARALADGAKTLARNPEHLSAALELFFRIQGVETMLTSLQEGVRKYQSPAEADKIARMVAENGANRNRLQQYIVNLASAREQEFQVMDREAQRCRAVVTQAPRGRKK
jgi:hypothetical protein